MSHFQNFLQILQDFETAMLVTQTHKGALRARPMMIADVSSHGDLQFGTRISSGKVDEITDELNVAVTCQGNAQYLSLSGRAMIINDREEIEQLYKPSWQRWFPGGWEDPDLRILRVNGVRGEYWDGQADSALNFIWETGKALFSNDAPEPSQSHGEVRLA